MVERWGFNRRLKLKKKRFKIIGVAILSITILIGGYFVYLYFNQPISVYKTKAFKSLGNPILDNQLTQEEVKEDIESIIEIMESTHPIFLEEVPDNYYTLKDELLAVSNSSMTVGELQRNISRYLSSIQDGHTSLWWKEDMLLDISWKYKDEKLILLDEDRKLTNKVVKQIGDVDIDEIVQYIKETFPAENYVAEAKNIENYAKGMLLLESTGVEFLESINLTLEREGKEEILQVGFNKGADYGYRDSSIYSKKIDESTAYVRLGTCEVNGSLESVVENIKKYKNEGTKNFIIDVIDNSGGDSNACNMLLQALDMKPGSYGGIIRFSPLAQEQGGYLRQSGSIKYQSSNEVSKNGDINLYILTNEVTFSSAQMLCVWVADGGLGTLVGRPSSNMPSNYGDILSYQLKNSKILGQISYKKWTRPDVTRDKERVLEPNIYVDYGDDILERTLEEIRNSI